MHADAISFGLAGLGELGASRSTANVMTRRITPGDVITGDVIKFRLDLETLLPYGAQWQTPTEERFKTLLSKRGLREVKLVDQGTWGTAGRIEGEAVFATNSSLSTRDVAERIAFNAREVGIRVARAFVEILVPVEQSANYKSPSQIRNVRDERNNTDDASDGRKSFGEQVEDLFNDAASTLKIGGSGMVLGGVAVVGLLLFLGRR